MDLIEIGERIREQRSAQKITQLDLARRAGISRTRLSQLESGKANDMNFITIMRVLNAVRLDLKMSDYHSGRPTLAQIMAENDLDEETEHARDLPARRLG